MSLQLFLREYRHYSVALSSHADNCRDVIYKLLAFTAAMVIGPIGMYFLTVESIFKGKPRDYLDLLNTDLVGSATYAGITAAVTANVVLFAYIFVAWRDDQGERAADDKRKEKKAQ